MAEEPQPPTEPDAPAPAQPPSASPAAQPPAPATPPTSARARRRWPAVLWALAAVLVVTAAALAFLLYQRANAERAASADLSEASALVERADDTVLAADAVIRASIDASVGVEATRVAGEIGPATDNLIAAVALIDRATADLPEEEVPQAHALRASADARIRMLEHAKPILETTVKVAASLAPADSGWAMLQDAEKLSDQAVTEYNKLTKSSVRKSKELTTDARKKVAGAKKLFGEAQVAYPSADLTAFVSYCDAKIESLDLSIKVDDAFLDDKPEDANELSDRFNAAEKKLLDQAKKLPESPRAVIGAAYEEDVKEPSAAYSQARAEATEADATYKTLTR